MKQNDKRQTQRLQRQGWLRRYFIAHTRSALDSLWRLGKTPFTNIMIISVIAIALALPASLWTLIKNVQVLTNQWQGQPTISLYLKQSLSAQDTEKLLRQVQVHDGVLQAVYISPEQGLAEFSQQSHFKDVLNALPENPLPGVIVIKPTPLALQPDHMLALFNHLKTLPEIEEAQMDQQWVKRLHAILDLLKKASKVVGSIIGVGVFLVIQNTIRLTIQKYHREIEVNKLIGATNAFIRRPFLYAGLLYGLLGAILSILIVSVTMLILDGKVKYLANLYSSNFSLISLDFNAAILLIVAGASIGGLAALMAVNQQLKFIRPS